MSINEMMKKGKTNERGERERERERDREGVDR